MEKVHSAIKFNQEAWLKLYSNINTELKKSVKIDFEKYFFKFMNNIVFKKNYGYVRNHRGIKLVTTEGRGSYLVSEPNYPKTDFLKRLISKRNEKDTDTHEQTSVFRSIKIKH